MKSSSKNESHQIDLGWNDWKRFSWSKERLPKIVFQFLYESIPSIQDIKNIEQGQLDNKLIESSIKTLEKKCESNTCTDIQLFNIALLKQFQGEYEESLMYLDKAIEINPNESCFYICRSLCLSETGQNKKSLSDLNTAIKLAPNITINFLNIADLQNDCQDYEQAILHYSRFIDCDLNLRETDDTYLSAYIGRGMAKRKIGDVKNAILDWSYASELGKGEAIYLLSCERVNDIFQKPYSLLKGLYKQAELKLTNGDAKGALSDFNEYLEFQKAFWEPSDTLNKIYLGRSKCRKALGEVEGEILDLSLASISAKKKSTISEHIKKAREQLSRERINNLRVHDELKKLTTSQKLKLTENPNEYEKWVKSDFTYQDWQRKGSSSKSPLDDIERLERRKLKRLEKNHYKNGITDYQYCEVVLSLSDSDGNLSKAIIDKLLQEHHTSRIIFSKKKQHSLQNLDDNNAIKILVQLGY